MKRPIRCVLAKVGLDGHQRGIQVVARAWRDAGYEVIYLGLRSTPEMVARTAMQEDADVVGLSILSGAHLHLARQTRRALDELGAGDIPLILGGVFPKFDVPTLREAGVCVTLRPGSSLAEVIQSVPEAIEMWRTHTGQSAKHETGTRG